MTWLDDLWTDIRYALRQMIAAPLFTAVAITTLALGIGANTAIFSVINAVLVRPLPYAHADRLVHIVQPSAGVTAASTGAMPNVFTALDAGQLAQLRAQTTTLSHVVTYGITTLTLEHQGATVTLDGAHLNVETFEMLGAPPAIGRVFSPRDATAAVIILSDSAWRRYFDADPNIAGRLITVGGGARAVVGVMPSRFSFPDAQTDFWIPYVAPAAVAGLRPPRLPVIARLKDGTPRAAAAAETDMILQALGAGAVAPPRAPGTPGTLGAPAPPPSSSSSSAGATSGSPTARERRFDLVGIEEEMIAPVERALAVLAVAVGFVLSIACVNVANLLLARGAAREREIATRLAIGASRQRLLRQMLTESVTLAAIGGVAGTALAFGGIRLLRMLGTTLVRRDLGPGLTIPRLHEVEIDAAVLIFTAAVALLTGVLFGLPPAIRRSRAELAGALREAAGSTASSRHLRAQHVLVVVEIAMAMLLFAGGGLLARSFLNLSQVNPGYDPSNVLTFQTRLPVERNLAEFSEQLVERLRARPDVRAAGYTRQLPMVRTRSMAPLRTTPELPAEPAPPPAAPGSVNPPRWPDTRHVSHGYLGAMKVRVINGRGLSNGDGTGQPQVMLINETLARSGILGPDPVGLHVYALGIAPWEIIGIVEDVRQAGLDEAPGPQVFLDVRQLPGATRLAGPMYFVVRTDADPMTIAPALRAIAASLDPHATLDNVATMEQLVANSIARPRLYAALMAVFALVAVVLAVVGIYGVVSYAVTERTREIGIRMALGAQRMDVIRLVLGQSGLLIAFGIAAGLAGTVLVTRYMRGMLFGLTALDPPTVIVVGVTMAAAALLASYAPARRATRVDPLRAIRER